MKARFCAYVIVGVDLRDPAVPDVDAVAGRVPVDEVADGGGVRAGDDVEDGDLRAEKGLGVLGDQVEIRLPALDIAVRARVDEILGQLQV
jgi:hypothetical protein